ncbi:hypothetical protein QTP86_024382 [Hemibagrus guttatus]|nr:hypothetical protein QTP86_024382 [Hemibagrus guttatus]
MAVVVNPGLDRSEQKGFHEKEETVLKLLNSPSCDIIRVLDILKKSQQTLIMMLLGSHFNSKASPGTISQQGYSCSEPLNSLPTWITQALCDLAHGEKELHRLTEKQTAEVDEVNQSLDSAIFDAQKEERHLLERVEKAHREAQQRLQQLKRENAAAARVGQSLVDRQLRKMGQLKEQILMWGRCPTGPNKSQILRGVKELMQPWEISISLKRVTFQPSPESNVIRFGEITVHEDSLTFPVGVCGPQGQKCALHTGQIELDNHVAVSEQLCAPCNSGEKKESSKTNSGSSRVVRKLRLSTAKDDVLGQKVKIPSPKTCKVWPCKHDNPESSQDEDSELLGSDSRGEDLFLAFNTVTSQGELEAESPVSEIRSHSFSKGHWKQRVPLFPFPAKNHPVHQKKVDLRTMDKTMNSKEKCHLL